MLTYKNDESIIYSILAVVNLLANNNKSQICYCGQILFRSATVNCSFSDNLTPLGVSFILLAMVQFVGTYLLPYFCVWRTKNFSILTPYCLTGTFLPQYQNFDLNLKRDHQKNFLRASRLWVGRRKEPILGYVPKNCERKNSGSNGLTALLQSNKHENYYWSAAIYLFLFCVWSVRPQRRTWQLLPKTRCLSTFPQLY